MVKVHSLNKRPLPEYPPEIAKDELLLCQIVQRLAKLGEVKEAIKTVEGIKSSIYKSLVLCEAAKQLLKTNDNQKAFEFVEKIDYATNKNELLNFMYKHLVATGQTA